MYLTQDKLDQIQDRCGVPWRATARATFSAREGELIARCAERSSRAHDVTLFIPRAAPGPAQFAVIRKPSYPDNLFRPPSGGVEPGELLEAGAVREAMEECGLKVTLDRYLLRVEAVFECPHGLVDWVTHVFLAHPAEGTPHPVDRKEIAAARWASVDEIRSEFHPRMLATEAGFRYRAELEAVALNLLGYGPAPTLHVLSLCSADSTQAGGAMAGAGEAR